MRDCSQHCAPAADHSTLTLPLHPPGPAATGNPNLQQEPVPDQFQPCRAHRLGEAPPRALAAGNLQVTLVRAGTHLTLQGGQRVLVTVEYDGLLGSSRRCPRPLPLRAVQTLHVELEVPVTVEPTEKREARGSLSRAAQDLCAEKNLPTGTTNTSKEMACLRS